jgi:hypothetical protein
MNQLADLFLDTGVPNLGPDRIRQMFAYDQCKYSDTPSVQTEPTLEQVAAVHH